MARLSVSDLLARVDAQIIADLVTDDDPQTLQRERPTVAELEDNDALAALLLDADGAIEVAMKVGKRYSADQLDDLSGASLSHYKRIAATIVAALAFERRAEKVNQEIAEKYREKADKYILDLQAGKNIFGLDDESDGEAGLIDTDGPTAIELESRNLLDERMHRYFPDGGSRLPSDRR